MTIPSNKGDKWVSSAPLTEVSKSPSNEEHKWVKGAVQGKMSNAFLEKNKEKLNALFGENIKFDFAKSPESTIKMGSHRVKVEIPLKSSTKKIADCSNFLQPKTIRSH